jgi:hypothetical protein
VVNTPGLWSHEFWGLSVQEDYDSTVSVDYEARFYACALFRVSADWNTRIDVLTYTIVFSVDRVMLLSRLCGYVSIFILMHSRSVLVSYEDTLVFLITWIDAQFLNQPVPGAEAADFGLTLEQLIRFIDII